MPIDALKIDRLFIADLAVDEVSSLVEMIVWLSHRLEATVIAEGIETMTQLARVSELGCDVAQGYLLSRPMRGQEAERLFARGATAIDERLAAASRSG